MANVEIQLGPDMIEEVMKDYERENPGKSADGMTPREFTDRMMTKMAATARHSDQTIQ